MKLPSFSMIVFLISVCIALPENDYDGPQEESQHPHNVLRNRLGNSASRAYNRMFSSAPRNDFQQRQNSQDAHSSKSLPPDDSMLASSFTVPESQLTDESRNPFSDLPNDLINSITLRMHSDKEATNLALSSKILFYAPTFTVIQNIQRFCSIDGVRVFPTLILIEPPTNECAESIIASKGLFQIQLLCMTGVPMTLDAAHLIASIVKSTDLFVLDLSGCELTDAMIVAISASLPHSMLTSLNVGSNEIGVEGARAIAAALPETMLTKLSLGNNEISDDGASAIATTLPYSKLTVLSLANNSIGADGASAIAAALPESMLTVLCYASNRIGVMGTRAIAAALPSSNLQTLFLGSNDIGVEGVIEIATALSRSELTSLFLENNNIGDGGARIIAAELPGSNLTLLVIGRNPIGDEGARAIAEAAPYSKMTYLDLGVCLIGKKGAKAIAVALPQSMLAYLNLGGNRISVMGARAIVSALPFSDLMFLDVSLNRLPFWYIFLLKKRVASMGLAEFELRLRHS